MEKKSLKKEQIPVIEVKHLTKQFNYWVDRPTSVKSMLVGLTRFEFNFGSKEHYVALKDISFTIHKGEYVGIMGRNGAGKSTLLKLLAGIYLPTHGEVIVREPLAPLIELGSGFDEELSGYENIFLNAAILGFGKNATLKAIPGILEFAELGDRIEMPLRKFSSGMLVRLAFSIATHLDAPILLSDEVLAVGDIGFQQKCIEKMKSLHREGRTVILITHDPESVKKTCERCIVLDQQSKVYDGPQEQGVELYKKLFQEVKLKNES